MTPQRRRTPRPVVAARGKASRTPAASVGLGTFVVGMCVALPGCVTERVEPAGRMSPYIAPGLDPSRPRSSFPQSPRSGDSASSAGVPAARFITRPLGDFVTDGLSLPLVSPDGQYLASRVGVPPTDELRLAPAPREGEAVPRIVTVDANDPSRIEVYRLEPNAQPTLILPANDPASSVDPQGSEPIPHGVLLGRSCNNEGFLIEWPRPDGSRWIGLVRWSTARVNWLVRSDETLQWLAASNAVLKPSGDLIFAYRTDPAQGWALARRSRAGVFDELDSTHAPIRWPVLSFSGSTLAQCVVRDGRARIERVDDNPRALDLGPAQHTLDLYNATIPHQPMTQPPQPNPVGGQSPSFETSTSPVNSLVSEWNEGFVVLEAGQPALSMWNSRLNRVLRAPTGVVAVHVHTKGLFFTSKTGLSYVPHAFSENRWVPTPARVVTPQAGLIRTSQGAASASSGGEAVVIHPIMGSDGLIRMFRVNLGEMAGVR